MSNRMIQNNKNRNNQTAAYVPTEEVSTEKFHYEELTPNQMAALYQER
jgi:peptidase E